MNHFPKKNITPFVIDPDNVVALENIFNTYQPQIVIHQCMKKHAFFYNTEIADIAGCNYIRTFKLAKMSQKFACKCFVLISSIGATAGGNFISESLRVAEWSLRHFFSGTPTRLIIARLGNIIENRGSIVSVIENQIRSRKSVIIPSADAETFLISKDTAAGIILKALNQALNQPLGEAIGLFEPGTTITFFEIARKLSNLYGLKIGTDVDVKYEASSSFQHDALAVQMHAKDACTAKGADVVTEDHLYSSERIKEALKNFVFASSTDITAFDWKRKTHELIDLCRESVLIGES
jgi:FlaA1/EpsC-like NDP-sugar epimerase